MPITSIPVTVKVLALSFLLGVVGCSVPESGSEYPGHRTLRQAAVVADAGTNDDGCDGGNDALWCPGSGPGDDPGSWGEEMNANIFGARGEYTSPSYVTGAPAGAASLARNVVVDVPGEYTTRNGFEILGPGFPDGVGATAMAYFQGHIIIHGQNGKLYRMSSSTYPVEYPGIYYPPTVGVEPEEEGGDDIVGVVQFVELNSTLYFNTSAGVYRLESVTGTPQLAGVAPATAGTATLTGTDGIALPGGSAVAYRYLWGRRAENGNIMLGTPSDRLVVENPNVDLTPTAVQRTTNVVTVTFASAHGRSAGDYITVFFNDVTDAGNFESGEYEITAVTTTPPYTLTYAESAADATASAPGEVIVRYTPPAQDVEHVVPLPPEADSSYFLQAYRSEAADPNVGPSDEMALVYEVAVADLPTGATTATFTDGTPDALRATALYTNADAGDGVLAGRNRPPLAGVQTMWKNRAFYANVRFADSLALTVLAAGGSGMTVDHAFTVEGNGWSETYTAGLAESFPDTFKVYSGGTPSENVVNTVASLAAAINSRVGGRLYASAGEGGIPGTLGGITLTARSVSEETFTIRAGQASSYIIPALSFSATVVAMERALNKTVVETSRPHGFLPGQTVRRVASGTPDVNFPEGTFTVDLVPNAYEFRVDDPGATAVAVTTGYTYENVAAPVESDDDHSPGGWAASEEFAPDAVTQRAANVAGGREKRVLGFLPLGEALFMLKEDGLFRLTGDGPQNFDVETVDNTVSFVAPRAALVIGQTAYALTTQGLMAWTENGKPVPASVPIESELRALVESARAGVNAYSFALNHDARRRAYFFLPSSATDYAATQVLVYNTLTDTWTRWDRAFGAALVEPGTDRLIAAVTDAETGLVTHVARERLTGTNADYEDEDGSAIQAEVTYLPFVGSGPSVLKQTSWVHACFSGALPSSVDFGFASNWNPTPTWFTVSNDWSQRPGCISTPPTIAHSRGNTFTVGIRHAQVGEPLRLLGYSLVFREYGGG